MRLRRRVSPSNNSIDCLAIDFIAPELTREIGGGPVFLLRPLSNGEMMLAKQSVSLLSGRGIVPSTQLIIGLSYGLLGWEGLRYNGEDVPFSKEAIALLPHAIKVRLANKVWQISILSSEQAEAIRAVVRAARLAQDASNPSDWDCESCMGVKGLQRLRRCPLPESKVSSKLLIDPVHEKYLKPWEIKKLKAGKLPHSSKMQGHDYDTCPIGLVDEWAAAWVNMVVGCQTSNSLPFMPAVWAAQPHLYGEICSIVSQETQRKKPVDEGTVEEKEDEPEAKGVEKIASGLSESLRRRLGAA